MNPDLSFLAEKSSHPPRVLIVSPHPDDEVIGAGARLPFLPNAIVVQVTDGAPAEMHDALSAGFTTRADYSQARRAELLRALALCGISRTVELHIPDQRAPFHLLPLTRQIQRLVESFEPQFVLTVPYEGGHPDHDATALAVHQACANLAAPPPIIEMLSYHNECGKCVMDRFLNENGDVLTVHLSPQEIIFKRCLFDLFPTQSRVLQWFPVAREKFRRAPEYDFANPPHEGQLYYEMFPWGMTASDWCNLARRGLCLEPELSLA